MNTGIKRYLDFESVTILKGLAILIIVVHNFCIHLSFTPEENEFTFHISGNTALYNQIISPDRYLLLDILAYFGHYFVALFVFISGYGLVRKYEQKEKNIGLFEFIKAHYIKLAILLLPTLLVFFIVMSAIDAGYFQSNILELGLMALFVDNLYFGGGHILGPWWFFSMIMQLYVVYRLFAYKRSLKPIILLTILCLLLQIITIPGIGHNYRLPFIRQNFPGYILPFLLGIIFARNGYLPTAKIAAISTILFLLSCLNVYTWLLSFAFFPIIIIPLVKPLRKFPAVAKILRWLGMMSAYIFVIHPVIREIFLSSPTSIWAGMPYIILTIYTLLSLAAALPVKRITIIIKNRITKQ